MPGQRITYPGTLSLHARFVGRVREMQDLQGALGRVLETGQPEVVSIVGGAGVGKTRLLHEFLSQVRESDKRVLAYRGSSRPNGAAFAVVKRILKARFGILEGAEPEETAQVFREMITGLLEDRRVTEFVHFLGAYLELQFPESPFIRAFEDDPRQFALVSRTILRRFFELDARRTPLILTFEDLHWGTDDCLDLVLYLLSALQDAPVLMVLVARPELMARRDDWQREAERHTAINLSPLSEDEAGELMRLLLATARGPVDDLVDAGVEVSAGSPFLLEQMVRAYHENGTLTSRADGSWQVHLERLDDAVLPLSVDDAIFARVSSLTPPERTLLEQASTMGGVFWFGALVALSRIDQDSPELWGGRGSIVLDYEELLAGLEERDYVLRLPDSSVPGDVEYAFKHNLERETLHRLTNLASRRRFHTCVAEWLEFRVGELGEEQLEMLAYHYAEGGQVSRAGELYLQAGDRARARYANAKAAEYYAKGLESVEAVSAARRIDAWHNYGDVLQLSGENERALECFVHMQRMAYRLDLRAKGGAAHNRIGRLYRAIGHLDEAMRHLGTGQALFESAGDRRGVGASLDDIGKVHWMRGGYEAAEEFIRRSVEIRMEEQDQRSLALSYNNLGLVYQDSGRFSEALTAFQEALVLRRENGDLPGICQTLNNLGTIHQDAGDHEKAVELYQQSLSVAEEVGDRMRQAVILTNLGESHYRRGAPAEAIKMLKQAEEISETLGDRILEGEILRGLAKAYLLVHDSERAREYIRSSVDLLRLVGGKPFLGVALRTQGEIFARTTGTAEDTEQALGAMRQSVKIFEELQNDIEHARSCSLLADFLEEQPDSDSRRAEINRLRESAAVTRRRLAPSDEYALRDSTDPDAATEETLRMKNMPDPDEALDESGFDEEATTAPEGHAGT